LFLLFDPYSDRQWSMGEIRLLNKVADAMICANDDIDPREIAGAIRHVFRPGMDAQPLLVHATRRLRAEYMQPESSDDHF